MKCSNCQFESTHNVRFCGHCGTSLVQICGSCGFANPLDFSFCGDCGSSVKKDLIQSHVSKSTVPDQPILNHDREAERRHLTVMFCDLVGSTALSARLDPEDLRHIVTEYQKVCQKIVARFEGHIAQYLGDGILVYFGYPIAHENDAHRAVSAGLAMIEAMEQLNVRLEAEKEVQIQIRIGIHTGHTVVGDILSPDGQNQRLAHGATLNIAARLEGLAAPDTMVISEITYALIHRHFVCEDKGKHMIKGIDKSVHIYQVVSENTARTRLGDIQSSSNQPPLFGRDSELNKLLELWEAAKENRSHIALLNGGAGVGKSRLLQALTQKVAEDDNAWLIAHQCSPYHQKAPFYPIAFGIKHVALRIEGHESTAEQINRLEGFIIQNGMLLEEMMPLFASMVNISLEGSDYQTSPFSLEQQHGKIVDALINIYLKRAKKQPVLLTFEDLHWIDSFSLRVLDKMIQQAPTSRILVVLSFRPSFQIPWGMKSHLIPISLGNLTDEAIRAIIQKISAGKRLPEDLIQKIIQKTDGVPLFVEELTKMVLNSDMVTEFEEHFELTKPIDSLAIPSTLQDSLIARLNNMADSKSVAQIGATIGRHFDYALIKTIAGMGEDSLRFSLEELVHTELLLQEGLLPQATFKFRHALIRDAAYQSLLSSQQKKIHLKIASNLTRFFPENVEESPQIAAYHYEKGDQTREAIIHWTKAGDKSRKRQAFSESLDYLERGLKLIEVLDEDSDRNQLELALLSIQAPIFVITDGFTSRSAYQTSKRMQELAEQLVDNISLFHALRIQTTYQLFAEKPQNAFHSAQQALNIAEIEAEQDLLIEAYRLIGQVSNYTGKYQDSLDSFDEASALYLEREKKGKYHFVTGDSHIFCLLQSCQSLWYLGYPDQATQRAKEALSKAAKKEQIFVQAIGLFMSCFLSVLRGDIEACAKHTEACMEICTEYGIKQILGEIRIYEAYLLLKNGQIEKGIELIELAFHNRIQRNVNNGIHFHSMSIIQAYLEMGAIQKGLDLVAKSLDNFEMLGDQLCLSEIYRLKGELLFANNEETYLAEIADCYETSWQLTQTQGAKFFELRTAMSFARFQQYQNNPKSAFERLSRTYSWFTEGFDIVDLREAKILLDTLRISSN